MDNLGGHSGRADDYHYHVAPTHLNDTVGSNYPIAFMLDGYPLYGLNEPGGTAVDTSTLDASKGHEHDDLGYHYHASSSYPYVNQSMYGTVSTATDSQNNTNFIDPQATTTAIRPAGEPLNGAVITGFTANADKTDFSVTYTYNNESYTLTYTLSNGVWTFTIPNHDGTSSIENYNAVTPGGSRVNRFTHPHEH